MSSVPFLPLVTHSPELGLVLSVLIGFFFGFVLERAGFGRGDKLAAQFYFTDMTVFKVMFSAIVTAMLGVVLAAGLGLVELRALSETAVSQTFIWSMLIGGLLLGVGFVTSGYCPGTSVVAMASGNLDALFSFIGVILGSWIFAEGFPLWGKLYNNGPQGFLFLYDLLGISPAVLAMLITAIALLAFLGAEKVEKMMAQKRGATEALKEHARSPRRLAFSVLGAGALLALGTLALPLAPAAAPVKQAMVISPTDLAQRILDEPWTLLIMDLRAEKECVKQRIPGSQCAPAATLGKLGLPNMAGQRDLVLVGSGSLKQAPRPALAYPGKVMSLEGGFSGWKAFALTAPPVPGANASTEARKAYSFRSALHSAMTGLKAPPPPTGVNKYVPTAKKKKGGGCS